MRRRSVKKKAMLAVLALAAVPLFARAERDSFARNEGETGGRAASAPQLNEDVPGFLIWSRPELKSYGKKLAPKMNEKKLASERLAAFGNHLAMIAHREADGEAELHETQADFFVVQGLWSAGKWWTARPRRRARCAGRRSREGSGRRWDRGTSSTSRPRFRTSSSSPRARSSPTS
jgi:hypothetical protein